MTIIEKQHFRSNEDCVSGAGLNVTIGKEKSSTVILLIGKSRLLREAIGKSLLAYCPAYKVVELEGGAEMLSSIEAEPAIALICVGSKSVADVTISSLIAAVRSFARDLPIMVISNKRDQSEVALAATTLCGFFCVDGGIKLLMAAIQLILAGGRYFPTQILSAEKSKSVSSRPALAEFTKL